MLFLGHPNREHAVPPSPSTTGLQLEGSPFVSRVRSAANVRLSPDRCPPTTTPTRTERAGGQVQMTGGRRAAHDVIGGWLPVAALLSVSVFTAGRPGPRRSEPGRSSGALPRAGGPACRTVTSRP